MKIWEANSIMGISINHQTPTPKKQGEKNLRKKIKLNVKLN